MVITRRKIKLYLPLIVISVVLLIIFYFIYSLNSTTLIQRGGRSILFYIGAKHRTDKVYSHHYDKIYEKYLSPYRGTSVRLLEIGLGCGMPYGVGASALTWREYLGERAEIHFIEFNETCAENWTKTTGNQANINLHYGSQEDIDFLEKFKSNMPLFDVIIDDGGHTMNQQKTSFITLLPQVRSGGIYVIEDLETSYNAVYEGGYLNPNSTISLIKTLIDELQTESPTKTMPYSDKIFSFEISDGICFFTIK